MEATDLETAFDSFDETWAPRLAAEINDHAVKVAKLDGEFVWHSHPETDELFWVVDGGPLDIEFRDRPTVTLEQNQLLVVRAGVEHRPVARAMTDVVLFEAEGTANTGDTGGERTREIERLD